MKPDTALLTPHAALRRTKDCTAWRGCEIIILAYFTYLPCLGLIWRLSVGRLLCLALIPPLLGWIWQAQSRSTRRPVQVARDWWPLTLVLIGYWAVGWFAAPPHAALQTGFLRWDRLLLYDAHLQAGIESAGPVFPALLETVYLCLYAIPPLCVGILYACGRRSQVPRFLLFLFAGTFSAYALLPFLPVISPRIAFPGADLPHYRATTWNVANWLLDCLDISTSVLPSGHVAVAFSSAFGLVSALPSRPIFGRCALGFAALVYVATIYCRYHYAVDGLISMVIVCAVCWLASRLSRP